MNWSNYYCNPLEGIYQTIIAIHWSEFIKLLLQSIGVNLSNYYWNPLKWIVKAQKLTVRGVLPAAISLTSVAYEYREEFINSKGTKVPSPNFSAVYIRDLLHIFVYMNWKEKALFWQISVLYAWKTINVCSGFKFFHSILSPFFQMEFEIVSVRECKR